MNLIMLSAETTQCSLGLCACRVMVRNGSPYEDEAGGKQCVHILYYIILYIYIYSFAFAS